MKLLSYISISNKLTLLAINKDQNQIITVIFSISRFQWFYQKIYFEVFLVISLYQQLLQVCIRLMPNHFKFSANFTTSDIDINIVVKSFSFISILQNLSPSASNFTSYIFLFLQLNNKGLIVFNDFNSKFFEMFNNY